MISGTGPAGTASSGFGVGPTGLASGRAGATGSNGSVGARLGVLGASSEEKTGPEGTGWNRG
jgi:hypothetical protein